MRENRYSKLIRLHKAAERVRSRLFEVVGQHAYETEAAAMADLLEDLVHNAHEIRESGLSEPHCVLPTFALLTFEKRLGELVQACERLEDAVLRYDRSGVFVEGGQKW